MQRKKPTMHRGYKYPMFRICTTLASSCSLWNTPAAMMSDSSFAVNLTQIERPE